MIGGASGVGKTSIARALARFYNIDLVRVDDFQLLLEATTTPEALPALHYWSTFPNWRDESVDDLVSRLIDVGKVLTPGLAAVARDHITENIPMVLEGDFILPEFAASFENPRIKSVFIHEPSREQILQNYFAREGEVQPCRANISHLYSSWLEKECLKSNIPVILSRPWSTLMERIANHIK